MAVAVQSELEVAYLLALSRLRGVGSRSLHPLLGALGSAEALWHAPVSQLRPLMAPARLEVLLAARKEVEPARLYEPYANHRLGIRLLGVTDPDYPLLLKETYAAPLVLYVRGEVSVLQGRTLAVVGTRLLSEYGAQATETLIAQLRGAQPCIVSGLAYGVDAVAHAAALNHHLPTVAVLGSGVDILAPAGNRKLAERILAEGGAVISEYPLGTQATKHTFPERNRIVAGLSRGTLMVEGNLKSGALITARLALEENRSVYAVPGSIFQETAQGPLRLIREGAMPVTHGQEIAADLGWDSEDDTVQERSCQLQLAATSTLNELEQRVLGLVSAEPVSIEWLQQQTGLTAAKLAEQLTMLELEGWLVGLPGGRVCRKT